ncbi:MAG: GAF domain-containing protein [Acidimicrobiales bacterium]
MPATAQHPLLYEVVSAAARATGATRGWLFGLSGSQMWVVAGYGPGAEARVGARGPWQFGWAGSVVASGHPLALSPRPEDPRFSADLVADPNHRPHSLMCFPCRHEGEPAGALQLEDKAAGVPFDVDDVELVTLLADVAAAALTEAATSGIDRPPAPEDLGVDLAALAAADPARYRTVATLVHEVLGQA